MRDQPAVRMLMVEKNGLQHYFLGEDEAALYRRAAALDGRFNERFKGERPPHHVAALTIKQLGRLRGEIDRLRNPGCDSHELVRMSLQHGRYLGSRSINMEALCAA